MDLFGMPTFVDGVTYASSFQLDQVMSFDMFGQAFDQSMAIEGSQEMSISDLPEGGKEIDVVVTHIAIHIDAMGMSTDFDSDHLDDQSDESLFAGLLGSTSIIVDDEGHVVSVSAKVEDLNTITKNNNNHNINTDMEFEEEVVVAKDEESGNVDPTDSLSHYQMVTRLAKILPENLVKPGDTWEVFSDLDGLGSVSGTASLLGYQQYDEHDVAVIQLEATLEINLNDISGIGDLMGSNNSSDGIIIHNASLNSLMFWDNTDKIIRWSQSNQTMIMEMPNPMDEGSTIVVPITQNITVAMDIIE